MTGFLDALKEARKAAVFEKVGVDEPTSKSDEGDAVDEQISPMPRPYILLLRRSLTEQQRLLSHVLDVTEKMKSAMADIESAATTKWPTKVEVRLRPNIRLSTLGKYITIPLIPEERESEPRLKLGTKIDPGALCHILPYGSADYISSHIDGIEFNRDAFEIPKRETKEAATSIWANFDRTAKQSAEPVRPVNINLSEDPEASARLIRASLRRVIKQHRDEIEALAYK